MPLIKVSAQSGCAAMASAITAMIREGNMPEVRAIGPAAVNQAVKAIATAHRYLWEDAIDIRCIPELINVEIQGQERTAVRFTLATKG